MTHPAFQIRVATLADIPALAVFAAHNFSQTFTHYDAEDLCAHLEKTCSEAYFTAALNEPGTFIMIAEEAERLIGYTMVGKVMLPAPAPVATQACEIYRLYVDQDYRGKKIGQALITAALATPQARHAPEIYLSVWSQNHAARHFYAKHGFVTVGEYLYPVGKHLDQEMILCKAI